MKFILAAALLLFNIDVKGEDLLEKFLKGCSSLKETESVIDLVKENNYFEKLPYGIPVRNKYRVSSGYGFRNHPITKKRSFHTGVDFAMKLASCIYSTADGKVIFVGRNGGYGKCIIIEHSFGFSTLYGHLSGYYVFEGDNISKGKVIGFVGSTGNSTGNHLHYEIRKNGKSVKPFVHN